MSTRVVAMTRRLRRQGKVEVLEEQLEVKGRERLGELVAELETVHLGKGEMLVQVLLDGKEVETPAGSELPIGPDQVVAVETVSVEQFILEELRNAQLHFNALQELLEDCLVPCRTRNMTEVSRLFLHLSSLLQWVALLTSNIELHLREYLEERRLYDEFSRISAGLNASMKHLLDLKDEGRFPEIATLIEGDLAIAVKNFNEFQRTTNWR